jgi:hypothetical protein
MLQPVTYTGPAVETTLDTDPVVDFSLDDLELGTGVAPVDETPLFDAMLSKLIFAAPRLLKPIGLEIIRKKHQMLIQTIGMISTILLLMIQKLFQKKLERCQRKK